VTNLNDSVPSAAGSLRRAIEDGIAAGSASITFAAGLSGTINLAAPLPTFTVNIFIAATPNTIVVNGGGNFQCFKTAAGTTDEIDNLEIDQGSAVSGGGIWNAGSLTLNNCYMRLCNASLSGGAIYNGEGILNLTNTQIYESTAQFGGAILNDGVGQVNIYSGTVIESNNATTDGGGIWNSQEGTVAIGDNVVVNDNHASRSGGGILNEGNLTMGYSSLTYNTADRSGGGLYSIAGGTDIVKLTGTDIENNSAANKGGGFYLATGSLTLDTCTLSNNTSPFGPGGAWKTGSTYNPPIGGTITDKVVNDP
jgi:hypothetical protein